MQTEVKHIHVDIISVFASSANIGQFFFLLLLLFLSFCCCLFSEIARHLLTIVADPKTDFLMTRLILNYIRVKAENSFKIHDFKL